MPFAIVRFTEDNDSTDIVARNWIYPDGKKCLYPPGLTKAKEKLTKACETPSSNWTEYSIRIVKEYATYDLARANLRQAEDTSDLEEGGARKKIKRNFQYPGEELTSSEELSSSFTDQEVYPIPVKKTSKRASHSIKASRKKSSLSSDFQNFSFSKAPLKIETSSKELERNNDSPPLPNTVLDVNAAAPNTGSICRGEVSEMCEKVTELTNNFATLECLVKEIFVKQTKILSAFSEQAANILRIEAKLDQLLSRRTSATGPESSALSDEMCWVMSSLPLDMEGFSKLNSLIRENPNFKQKLVKVLYSTGGRDVKGLTANLLRKLMLNDVGEKFSLTGRTTTAGPSKLSFEKTETYRIILDVCSRNYGGAKEGSVREAMSDWLMQAKFRKIRSKKRKLNQEDALPDVLDDDSC